MANRRKPQSRRKGNHRRIPLWMWLFVGILIGLGLSAGVLFWGKDKNLPFPRPNLTATAPAKPAPAPATPAPAEKPKPHYDFYALLQGKETQVSDRELADKAKSETTPAPEAPQPEPAPAPTRERYLLQAGAFKDQRDADSIKAQIALAGFQARVETVNVNGNTLHRVRLGPYASAGEVEQVKRQLADNGVPNTMAVRETLN